MVSLVVMCASLGRFGELAQPLPKLRPSRLRKLRQAVTVVLMKVHMTAREVVEQHGISHRTLMRMIENKEIRYAEKLPGVTGSYLFDPPEVERAFKQRSQQPPKDGRPPRVTA